ncbi:MAG: DUF3883 domain-containing protein [Methanoregula sp.]|jgi:hypothetical protein
MIDLRCLETIRSPGELNRLLIYVQELGNKNGQASLKRLEQALREQTFKAGPVPFEDLLNLALHFRLIHIHEDSVSVTPTGHTFLTGNPDSQYSLTETQTHLLVTSILFGRTQLSKQFEGILGDFSFNQKNQRYEGSNQAPSGRLSGLGIRLFIGSLGFLDEADNGIFFLDPIFNTQIARRIRIFRHPEWDGQEPSDEIIERSKQAEILVYRDEISRLDSVGFPELGRRVQLVSDYNAAAGYDIQSFEGLGSRPDVPDRFIEVKSSTQKKFAIVVTRNELEKAREFEEQYHIVFVGNFDTDKQLSECRVITLTDPVKHIFDPDKFKIDASKLHVIEKGSEEIEIIADE